MDNVINVAHSKKWLRYIINDNVKNDESLEYACHKNVDEIYYRNINEINFTRKFTKVPLLDKLKVLQGQNFVKEYCNLPLLSNSDNIYIHKIKVYKFHNIPYHYPEVLYSDFTKYDKNEFPNTDEKEYEYKQNEYVMPVVIYYSEDNINIIKARIPLLYWYTFMDIHRSIKSIHQNYYSGKIKIFPVYIKYKSYNDMITQFITKFNDYQFLPFETSFVKLEDVNNGEYFNSINPKRIESNYI